MLGITDLFNNFLIIFIAFGNDILVPALFTLGLIFFLYGLFNYFLLGPNDEDKKEEGRGQLINGNVGFFIGFVVWGFFQALVWLGSIEVSELLINLEYGDKVQPVPNAPTIR